MRVATRGIGVRATGDRSDRMHGRLPRPRPDELSPEQQAVHRSVLGGPRTGDPAFALADADGRLTGPFNVMLAAPGPGLALSELGAALRFRTSLSDRVREIAILTLSVLERSSFEWYAHEAVARRIGITEDELSAIAAGAVPSTFDDIERTVQHGVAELVTAGDLDETTYRDLESHLGTEGVVELIMLVGYYSLLALSMRVLRTPLPDGVTDPFEGDGS